MIFTKSHKQHYLTSNSIQLKNKNHFGIQASPSGFPFQNSGNPISSFSKESGRGGVHQIHS